VPQTETMKSINAISDTHLDLENLREQIQLSGQDLVKESGYIPPEPPDYFGTSWTDCLTNPEPIEWLVDGWIQSEALNMVFGPSGGGKTFLVLDWCLSMAAGRHYWAGNKIEPGAVVYLAGEGHHGLKGRIAAWLHHNRVQNPNPDNFTFTNRAADLNTDEGYGTVAGFLRELAKNPSLIVVDTTNLHFSGNENAADQVRTMINNCRRLIREFKCAVLLVHHTGVSQEAKGRVRGSSAWKASMDIEIEVQPTAIDPEVPAPIEIRQTKSKDSLPAAPIYVELEQVTIPGWYDRRDRPVGSAVLKQVKKPDAPAKEHPAMKHWRVFNAAYNAGGEIIKTEDYPNGVPFVGREAMREAISNLPSVNSEKSIKNHLTPSDPQKTVGSLIAGQFIAPYLDGWLAIASPDNNGSFNAMILFPA